MASIILRNELFAVSIVLIQLVSGLEALECAPRNQDLSCAASASRTLAESADEISAMQTNVDVRLVEDIEVDVDATQNANESTDLRIIPHINATQNVNASRDTPVGQSINATHQIESAPTKLAGKSHSHQLMLDVVHPQNAQVVGLEIESENQPDSVPQEHAIHSEEPSMLSSWSLEYKLCLGELSLVVLFVIIRELGLARDWFGKQECKPEQRWHMKGAECLRLFATAADYAFIIPISLNLSKALGGDSIVSGFIVGTFSAGVGCGTLCAMRIMAPANHKVKRRCLVFALLSSAVCEGVLALLMTVPSLQHTGLLTILILLVRCIAGFSSGWGGVHVVMLGQVCTPQEMNRFDAWCPLADFLGLAMGVFITAFCTSSLDPKDYFQASATPMLAVACLGSYVAILVSQYVPLDMEQVSYMNDETTEPRESVDYEPDILVANPGDVLTNRNRENIAVHGIMQLALCALATTGVEAGTSYIMEVYYHWSPVFIALGMSIVFVVICLVVAICNTCRIHWGTAIDRRIALPCCIMSCVATACYFQVPKILQGFEYFVGDAFVYPVATTVSGMVLGYAVWASNQDMWNYRENILITSQITDSAVKFAGAPLVRFLIDLGGRKPYAIMQVTLAILALFNFLWVRNVAMHIEQADLQEVVPSGKGFFRECKAKKDRFLKPFRAADWKSDD